MTDYRFAVDRHDGKRIDLCESRHEAAGRVCLYHECNDYAIVPVPRQRATVKLPRREQPHVKNNVWPERHTP